MMFVTGCSPLGSKKLFDVDKSKGVLNVLSQGIGGAYEGMESALGDFGPVQSSASGTFTVYLWDNDADGNSNGVFRCGEDKYSLTNNNDYQPFPSNCQISSPDKTKTVSITNIRIPKKHAGEVKKIKLIFNFGSSNVANRADLKLVVKGAIPGDGGDCNHPKKFLSPPTGQMSKAFVVYNDSCPKPPQQATASGGGT